MKKTIIILVVVVILAAAAVFYRVIFAPTAIETVLPGNAAVYVKFSDVDKQVEAFKASKLCKSIKDIDTEMLMEKSGAKKEEIENFKTAKNELTNFIAGLVIEKYFGKEIAVALYPLQVKDISPDTALDTASNITLVTRVNPETNFIDFISKILNKAGKKYEVVEENYNGRKITIIKLSDKVSLAYVRIKDLLVIGIGKKGAISCCDAADKKSTSLAQDKDYIAAMSKFPKGADTLAYGNIELMVSGFRQFMRSATKSFEEPGNTPKQEIQIQINKALDMYAGFKTFGYVQYPGKIIKEKMVLIVDKSKLLPLYASFYSIAPRKNTTLKFTPSNTIYYAWGSCDPKSYWNYLKAELGQKAEKTIQGPSFDDVVSGFEQKLGMNIDKDIIPALGDETGMFLNDINLDGLVPMPEFVLFVKVTKKQTIDKMMDHLFKEGKVDCQSEGYKGIDIKYIALPFGQNLQPAYCYVGDYLLVSLGRKPIKESIDVSAGVSKSVSENEDFKAVDYGLTGENNSVSFCRADVLLQKAKGICDWLLQWMVMMEEKAEQYRQMAIDEAETLAKEIEKEETEVQALKTNIQSLEKEIEGLTAQGADISQQQTAVNNLKNDIKVKQEIIGANKKHLDQFLKSGLQEQSQKKVDPALIKLYLNEAVYPILDGLQTIKAIGSKSVFKKDMVETELFYKVVE